MTQSCRGIQYTRFLLLNIYVNKCKEHSLACCAILTQRNLCSEGLTVFLLAVVCRWHACFFNNHQAAQNNPFECYCFVFPIHSDELCNSMRIGGLYRVLGIPAHVHQCPSITWSIEANNVQPWEPECKAINDLIFSFSPLNRTSYILITDTIFYISLHCLF